MPVGGEITIRATVRNVGAADVRLAVDYVVHHRKANGTQSPKTFKLTTVALKPGETATLRRVHSFRPITTRRYHPGEHAIELQINGVRTQRASLNLVAD